MIKPKKAAVVFLSLILTVSLFGCGAAPKEKSYGVFLSLTEDLEKLKDYETVVIDAQYFSEAEIESFKKGGGTVYTYLNVGSLEDFRDYYDDFKALTLGEYENWDEERWIDVSNEKWVDFIENELVPSLLEKGVDGFFVDNCDVYYNYPAEEILDGLSKIMRFLVGTGKKVLINGGDTFLDEYCRKGGKWSDVVTGINQETVFSRILWDGDQFSSAKKEDREYFTDYVERYAALGADIYLLEYTRSASLIEKIDAYCARNGFRYYISDSIELDG